MSRPTQLILAAVFGVTLSASAAIPLSTFDTPYTQDFDELGVISLVNETTGSTAGGEVRPWFNNVTLPGWYADIAPASEVSLDINNGNDAEGYYYVSGNGQSRTSRLPSLRNWGSYSTNTHVNPPTDRSFGYLAGAGTFPQSVGIGLAFANVSSDRAITGLTISMDMETWRRNTGGTQTQFGYAIMSTVEASRLRGADGWTNVPQLGFNAVAGAPAGLDGNLTAVTLFASFTLDRPVNPGEVLVLRWYQPLVNSGSGVGIDNLVVGFATEEAVAPPQTPVLSLAPEAGGLTIRWDQAAGRSGHLEGTESLGGEWLLIQTFQTPDAAAQIEYIDATWDTLIQRFYRVRIE